MFLTPAAFMRHLRRRLPSCLLIGLACGLLFTLAFRYGGRQSVPSAGFRNEQAAATQVLKDSAEAALSELKTDRTRIVEVLKQIDHFSSKDQQMPGRCEYYQLRVQDDTTMARSAELSQGDALLPLLRNPPLQEKLAAIYQINDQKFISNHLINTAYQASSGLLTLTAYGQNVSQAQQAVDAMAEAVGQLLAERLIGGGTRMQLVHLQGADISASLFKQERQQLLNDYFSNDKQIKEVQSRIDTINAMLSTAGMTPVARGWKASLLMAALVVLVVLLLYLFIDFRRRQPVYSPDDFAAYADLDNICCLPPGSTTFFRRNPRPKHCYQADGLAEAALLLRQKSAAFAERRPVWLNFGLDEQTLASLGADAATILSAFSEDFTKRLPDVAGRPLLLMIDREQVRSGALLNRLDLLKAMGFTIIGIIWR